MYTTEKLRKLQEAGRLKVLPAAPGTTLYELSARLVPGMEQEISKDGCHRMLYNDKFYIELEVTEKRFTEKELCAITENSLYGLHKTVFRTLEEAMAAAEQIQTRGVEIVRYTRT